MEDVRGLKELQLDALREVANIGAGHAATALSQMTNHTIMIAVPEVNVRPLEEVTDLVGRPDEVVAAVLMHMMGDLTGRTLVLFPEGSARTLCDILFRRSAGTTGEFGPMEQSGLKEAGNILASAYMNALSDFMGMMLVPSVPSLVIDISAAILTTTYLNFGHDRDFVFCVETSFRVEGAARAACAAISCSCPTRRRSGPFSTPSACPDPMPGPVLVGARSRRPALLCPPDRPLRRRRPQQPGRPLLSEGADRGRDRRVRPRARARPADAGGADQPRHRLPRERPLRPPRHRPQGARPPPARGPRRALGARRARTPPSAAIPTRSPSSRRCSPGSRATSRPCSSSASPKRRGATSTSPPTG